jgi:hypothetical protein
LGSLVSDWCWNFLLPGTPPMKDRGQFDAWVKTMTAQFEALPQLR